jgi:hypothetical protein
VEAERAEALAVTADDKMTRKIAALQCICQRTSALPRPMCLVRSAHRRAKRRR